MEAIQFLLNEQLVTITADAPTIKRLNDDDRYLADYINRAAKSGQFHFLFAKDPSLRRIVVKRVPLPLISVWCRKGRPSETDSAATLLLFKLRNSEKYASRFKDAFSLKSQLWGELADEMRLAGFDVDGPKCAQKFLHLSHNYQKNVSSEVLVELKRMVGGEKQDSDDEEEWIPKVARKRKKENDDEGEFLKKFLKKSSEMKVERFKEMCGLMKMRNQLVEEKLKQNREIIEILEKLANK